LAKPLFDVVPYRRAALADEDMPIVADDSAVQVSKHGPELRRVHVGLSLVKSLGQEIDRP
jgi:hypothetical protein